MAYQYALKEMKKNKILINIENLNEIEEYKKIGINNFLFAVKDFSIGYNSYTLEEIKELDCNKYLLINRIFNTNDVEEFKKIKNKLLDFEYIIFEDIAVYNILKDTNVKLIWNQTHFASNYSSINYWLELTYSAVISNELTKLEVIDILNKSTKNLVLNIFGKNPIMYSRRTLLSNFNKHFELENRSNAILEESITNNEFLATENDKGTFIVNNKHFNLIPFLNEFNDDKIQYYLIYPNDIEYSNMIKYIEEETNDNTDDGFMNKKTIYKLGVKK